MDVRDILISTAAGFFRLFVKDAEEIIKQAVVKAEELSRQEGLSCSERCKELKKWMRGQFPSIRSSLINSIMEAAVTVIKQTT